MLQFIILHEFKIVENSRLLEIVEKITKFYLGGKQISNETTGELTQVRVLVLSLFTDRKAILIVVNIPITDFARLVRTTILRHDSDQKRRECAHLHVRVRLLGKLEPLATSFYGSHLVLVKKNR